MGIYYFRWPWITVKCGTSSNEKCTKIEFRESIEDVFILVELIVFSSSSFVSSNRVLPFVYTLSGIFVELLKVVQSAVMCKYLGIVT